MSFLKDIVDGLRRTVGYIEDPFKVKDSYSDQYQFCNVVLREDFLVLYSKTLEADKLLYEIVVQKVMSKASPATIFSLLRSEDKREAESIFHLLKFVLPAFVSSTPDFFTRDNLQEICNAARKCPTWGPAHIAAYLGWPECFKQEPFQKKINEVCPKSFVTPLHLAIKEQKITVIQVLLGMDVRLDMLDKEGNGAYHYASTTNKEIIQALVSREPRVPMINERNADGHTPLHLACLADNPICVQELLRSGADVNLAGTHDGLPLQCAVESSSDQCAKEIIDMYPNQLHTKDMITGGTPLHWAKTPQCLEALVELGCLINAKNFQGDTALHMMVSRSRFSCVVNLLSHGANPDIRGAEGNTPLHLAVKSGDPLLAQALAVFDSEPNIPNDAGDTARHIAATSNALQSKDTILYILHAIGAKRCSDKRKNCSHGCAANGDFNGIIPDKLSQLGIPKCKNLLVALKKSYCNPFFIVYDDLLGTTAVREALAKKNNPNEKPSKQPARILCLDGGGIRGLVLIQALSVLEATLGAPVMKHFDWVAGTSTGGILALALSMGKSVRECRCLYFRLKDKVFVGHRPYDPEPLEAFLQKEFGEKTTMDDIKGLKVMVTAVLADRHPADLHLFRNYKSPAKIMGQSDCTVFTPTLEPHAQLVWRACRASGAAPTYFRALGRFLDGGLIANNPTLDALTELHQRNLALKATGQEDQVEKIGLVVSLGTGKIPVLPISTIDVFKPDSIWSAAKIVVGVSALGQLLVDKVTEADGRVVERAQAWCSMINVPYFRLNPPITENINLDEVDNKILVRMLWETNAYLTNRKSELQELATLLKH